jgi:hypothetical protein
MKKPIIEDFDINARTRELNSPLDGMPSIQRPQAVQQASQSSPRNQDNDRTERANARSGERTSERTGRRIITRNSFEIFEDQMDSLRERSFQDKREGKLGSMSAMVRDAIDEYLRKHPIKD